MNSTDIVNLVSSVGFPIVMCGVLLYYMVKDNEKHRQEVKDLTDTIANNTKVLAELQTLIKTMYEKDR